jgi:hypothetical protein
MREHPGVYIKSMPEPYGTTPILRVWLSARADSLDKAQAMVEAAVETLSRVSGLRPQAVDP